MAEKPQNNSTDNIVRVIDRYHIRERIGTGGMARVFRAVDTTLDRDVAVKVLHEYMADDDTFRARFEREAKFLASFHHPNVVQIYDYATIHQERGFLCYMVMTYLSGGSLEAIMKTNTTQKSLMPTSKVIRLAYDIAAALHYAHEMGMVHRDVKPANILFDSEGRAVLTDFGIARMVQNSNLTQENVAIGTPAYMAPEQVSGGEVDNRTDIYAFGIILYELLTGCPPFGDDGSVSVLLKHLSEPVPAATLFDHIDNPNLDAVLFKALAKNPDERYQSSLDLAADLEKALKGEQIPNLKPVQPTKTTNDIIANPVQTTSTAVQTPQPYSVMGILAAGLAAILIVVIAAFALNANPAPDVVDVLQQPAPVIAADAGVDSMVDETTEELAPSMTTLENMGFVSEFTEDDPLVGIYWSLESTVDEDRPGMITREIGSNDTYIFSNSIPDRAATTIAEDFRFTDDITIIADLTLDEDSPPRSGYGLVFHHTDSANYGVFAVDGNGNHSIWFLQDRVWRELRNLDNGVEWTPSSAVNLMGETNTLRLEIRGDMLTGYVNDTEVVQVEDDALTAGEVGLYLAIPRTTDAASVTVDRYEVIVADEENTASSMTADSDAETDHASSQ